MTQQADLTDVTTRLEAAAEQTVAADQLGGAPQALADAAAQAGLLATTGTIAFAGRYASGSFAVQYNDHTGGYSSTWPQWAFELAKDALLGGKRVWVAANGKPFGSNLVFVLVLP